ncbi:MAG: ATP-binding protein [Campylobacterales bacterium]|nr:ATP-binding protein [Campylobacterales bacterium]
MNSKTLHFTLLENINKAKWADIQIYQYRFEKYIQSARSNSTIVKQTLKILHKKRSLYIKLYMSERSEDRLWNHRYANLFLELCGKNGVDILEYFVKAVEITDHAEHKNYLAAFSNKHMTANMHAYVTAEILRPTLLLLIKKLSKYLGQEQLDAISILCEISFRISILLAEDAINRIILDRRAKIEGILFYMKSRAQSDRLFNTFGMLVKDVKIARKRHKKSGNIKSLECFMDKYNDECLHEYEKFILDAGKLYSSYGNGKTQISHLKFLLDFTFPKEKLHLELFADNDTEMTYINMPEVSFLKAFYPLYENAIEFGATRMKVIFKTNEAKKIIVIEIRNDGRPLSVLAKEYCLLRFFSDSLPGKHGLGLYISSQDIGRFGGKLYVDKNNDASFLMELPYSKDLQEGIS